MTRREARELAFVLLFEKSFKDEPLEQIIQNASACRDIEVDPFAVDLAQHVVDQKETLDQKISEYSKSWKLNRISRVTRCILQLCMYEMLYREDIPVSVSINEAVEITKKYATQEDASFVNGLLGAFSKELAATSK